jgi:hypothetical protein
MITKAKTASLFLTAFLSVIFNGDSNLRMLASAESLKTAAPVLPAENFFGNAKLGYLAAKRVPDICEKLFCYCGCDLTDNHSSLLDCFTSDHGVDCNICQEEALLADKMHTAGSSLAEIQKVIDQKYAPEYNSIFNKPSKMLLEYRSKRKWKPTAAELAQEGALPQQVVEDDLSKRSEKDSSFNKTKEPMNNQAAKKQEVKKENARKTGSCCGHNDGDEAKEANDAKNDKNARIRNQNN